MRFFLRILIWLIVLVVFTIGFFLLKPYELQDIPSTKVFDRNWILLYDVRDEYRKDLISSVEYFPQDFLNNFLIKKEDKNFWKHNGVDFLAITRALQKNLIEWQILWASTIDQQVIKLSQQAFDRTFLQKIKEIVLARNININYSKNEILTYYLNNLYFPNWVQWYSTACKIFFNKDCRDLSNGHLIYLYAKSKFPSDQNLSQYCFDISQKYGFTGYSVENFVEIAQEESFFVNTNARFFVDFFLKNYEVGIQNITSFDSKIYNKIQWILNNYASYLQKKEAKNSCVIVLENWEIVSMNSFPTYWASGYFLNNCLSKRQVWSAIKPFLYLSVFEKLWYNADTKITDEPVTYDSEYGSYSPKNFDLKYHGEVSLASALGNSFNVPAVKLLYELWLREFYQFLSEIGRMVSTNEEWKDNYSAYWLALALWVKEISPLDFTKMWQVFNPSFCSNLNKKNVSFCGKYSKKISELTKILSENHNRLISFGQYNRLNIEWVYDKSWTSRKFVDAWVCGGKKSYTVCVWAGNDTTKEMLWGWNEVVWPIWYEIMQSL